MKKFKLSIVKTLSISLALLLLLSVNAYGQKDLEKIKDAYAKKIITTEMAGVKIEIIKEIYFSKNGNIKAIYETENRNISMANINEKKESVIIWNFDTGTTTTYDPEKRKGYEINIDLDDKISGISEKDAQMMAEQIKQSTGTETEDLGKKNILGHTCTGTRATSNIMGMNTIVDFWMLENTSFIMESNSSGSGVDTKEIVTELKFGFDFDPKKLEVPSDVEIKKMKSPF